LNANENPTEDQLVLLMKTQSESEANIIRGLLEESSIPCALITPVPHNIYPFTVDGLAVIQIKVLASQLESARSLLSDYEAKVDIEGADLPEEEK
jgi:hypothetical protein